MAKATNKPLTDFFAGMEEVLSELPSEEIGRLFLSCVKYCTSGETPEIDGNAKMVFLMLKHQFDQEKKQKKSRSEINRQNAQKRWDKAGN